MDPDNDGLFERPLDRGSLGDPEPDAARRREHAGAIWRVAERLLREPELRALSNTLQRYAAGRFLGTVQAKSGDWRLELDLTVQDGEPLQALRWGRRRLVVVGGAACARAASDALSDAPVCLLDCFDPEAPGHAAGDPQVRDETPAPPGAPPAAPPAAAVPPRERAAALRELWAQAAAQDLLPRDLPFAAKRAAHRLACEGAPVCVAWEDGRGRTLRLRAPAAG